MGCSGLFMKAEFLFHCPLRRSCQTDPRKAFPPLPLPSRQTQLTAEPSELKLSGASQDNTLAGSGNHVSQDIFNLLQVGLGCVQVTESDRGRERLFSGCVKARVPEAACEVELAAWCLTFVE